MSSVTVELPDETRQKLQDRAVRSGQTLENYLQRVLQAEAEGSAYHRSPAATTPAEDLSIEEFEKRLDALNDGLLPVQPLPSDFSRADIYYDHD